MKREFSRELFEKKAQISNFMEILPAGADLFCAEGRTNGRTGGDMTKLTVAFRNFCGRA
jgi:hypothetical protein